MSVDTPGSPAISKSDTERLHELGCAQELGRPHASCSGA